MFSIENGLLKDPIVKHVPTTKVGNGTNKKKFIVVHYTAGGNFDNDVKTLSSSPKQVSCHLVIGRNGGEIVQVGNFDQVQWHAGASQWEGINGLNSYSIGIEMTNPGWMELSTDEKSATTYYGARYDVEKDNLVIARHPALGSKKYAWLPYTEFQLQTLQDIVEALKSEYKTITEVVGHEQISPGRKQDPGIGIILSEKLMDKMNEKGFDGSDHFYDGVDDKAAENRTYDENGEGIYQVVTNGTALRIRKDYSSTSEVIGSLNNEQLVRVERIIAGFAKLSSTSKAYLSNQVDFAPPETKLTGYASVAYLKKIR